MLPLKSEACPENPAQCTSFLRDDVVNIEHNCHSKTGFTRAQIDAMKGQLRELFVECSAARGRNWWLQTRMFAVLEGDG